MHRGALLLVIALATSGCLEARPSSSSGAGLPVATPCAELANATNLTCPPTPTLTPTTSTPPTPTTVPPPPTPTPPAPTNEWRPAYCGGGTHGTAEPHCLVVPLPNASNAKWEDLAATTDAGAPVAHDRGTQPANGTAQPSPPSRAGQTPIAWCVADAWQTEAWCRYGTDPSGPIANESNVLVWWTDDAAATGVRVVIRDDTASRVLVETDVLVPAT